MTNQSLSSSANGDSASEPFRALSLRGADAVPDEVRADWIRYVEEHSLNDLWARPVLSQRDRSLVTVAALATLRCPIELASQVGVARQHGLSRRELCEVMFQVSGYGGIATGLEGMSVLRQVFETEADVDADADSDTDGETASPATSSADLTPDNDRWSRGREILVKLRPDLPAIQPPQEPDPIAPDWSKWLIGTAFGDLWLRPGLTLVERERASLAVLVVLGKEPELSSHVRISVALGIPPVEIGETIMHLAVYVGFPCAVGAIRVATETLREMNLSDQ
jgi:4-carboxymuconolactone decarboxylase